MKNTISISIILLSIFVLNSCGFHTPTKQNVINFNVSGDREFSRIINSKLNVGAPKTLTVKILELSKNKTNASYSSGVVSNYNLEVIAHYVVYKNNEEIYSNQLSANFYLKNLNNSANEYQEDLVYKDLQEKLATKIIHKVSRL